MTDYFKSALGGIFGQPGGGQGAQNTSNNTTTQSNSHQNNDFVGQNIAIGTYKLKITKLIAEGNY